MKSYIVVSRYAYSPHATIFNGAMFNSKQEANKVAEYQTLKLKTERELSEKFWGEKQATDLPIMQIVEISIPDTFWKD
jgi:hypothetical protein